MKLTKFGLLVNCFFVHFNKRITNISSGCAKILEIPEGSWGGGGFWGPILENQEGKLRVSYSKSLLWGWYGYFLEPHIGIRGFFLTASQHTFPALHLLYSIAPNEKENLWHPGKLTCRNLSLFEHWVKCLISTKKTYLWRNYENNVQITY